MRKTVLERVATMNTNTMKVMTTEAVMVGEDGDEEGVDGEIGVEIGTTTRITEITTATITRMGTTIDTTNAITTAIAITSIPRTTTNGCACDRRIYQRSTC